jgi:hypothetical protein
VTEVVVLPMAAEADVERFRGALASLLEERAGDATTHRVVVRPLRPAPETGTLDHPDRIVLVAVEASHGGLRRLWQAGLEHPAAASDARGFVIVRRAPPTFGEPDPALALPATLTHLFDRPRADPAWRLADVAVSDALAAAAGRPDADHRPVYALREADGLDAPTTREAAALEGHYRALVDRLFPAARRRPAVVQTMNALIERRLLLQITTDDPRTFELHDELGIVVLVAPSGAGKSVFLQGLARQRDLPVVRLGTVSAPARLARWLQVAQVADGRLRCAIDAFEASPAWLGNNQQAAFAHELVDALREIRESRDATGFDLVLALRPSEHVETLATALRTLGPVTPVRLAPLDSKQAHDFARTHVGDDAGILLRRLDEIGVTAHREDLRYFGDLCAYWRDTPDEFAADPVAVMGFGMDRRLAPADKKSTWSAVDRRETAAAVAFASTLTNRLRVAGPDAPHEPTSLTEAELVRLTGEDRLRLWDTLSVNRLFESDAVATSFQHESDREFLAAEFLASLPSHLVERWMVVGDGEHARVPFSLRAVGRWLLLRAPEERVRWLLTVEPTLVVEALPWLRPALQAPAVEALIAAHRAGRFPIWMAEGHLTERASLFGSEVRELLLGALDDRSDRFLRRFAARALGQLREPTVAARLLARAVDETEETDVREAAADGVLRSGNDTAIRSLEPLLDLPPADDPDQELRGLALRALWPRHIDARRFFGALEPWPKHEVIGTYTSLFWNAAKTLAGLRAADIPIAVEWAAGKLTDPDVFWVGEATGHQVARFAMELSRRALGMRPPAEVGSPWADLCLRAIQCRQVAALRRPEDRTLWRNAARMFLSSVAHPEEAWTLVDVGVLDAADLDWVSAEAAKPEAPAAWGTLATWLRAPAPSSGLFEAIRTHHTNARDRQRPSAPVVAPATPAAALHRIVGDDASAWDIRLTLTELERAPAIDLAFELLDVDHVAKAVRREILRFLLQRDESTRSRARTWALAHLDRDGVMAALIRHDPEPALLRQLIASGQSERAAQLLASHSDLAGMGRNCSPLFQTLSLHERVVLIDALLAVARTPSQHGNVADSGIAVNARALGRALIQRLVEAGEVAALTDLASRHPDLQPEAERARVQRAQLDWRPPTLDDLIAGSPRIDTVDGFQRRIVDAFEAIQRFDLDGDGAFSEGLWNETNLKQETDLRHWLKSVLKRTDRLPRGVLVGGAEAELREGRQRTDLVLQRTEGARKLCVVVEVKRAPDVAPGTLPAKAYKQLADYLNALAASGDVRGILVVFIANARRRDEWLRALTPPDERARAFVFCVPPRPGKRGANG